MKANSESGTWKWRRPTAWGLAILGFLAVFEGILLYCVFFSDSFGYENNGIFNFASLVIGSLLAICASLLLTEKTSG